MAMFWVVTVMLHFIAILKLVITCWINTKQSQSLIFLLYLNEF